MAALLSKMHDEGLNTSDDVERSAKMPVLFVGHGSPMNAIEENEFAAGWRDIGKKRSFNAASRNWNTCLKLPEMCRE